MFYDNTIMHENKTYRVTVDAGPEADNTWHWNVDGGPVLRGTLSLPDVILHTVLSRIEREERRAAEHTNDHFDTWKEHEA